MTIESRLAKFPRECGKNGHFPRYPAGNAGKDSTAKLANFLQKLVGSELKIFFRIDKNVQNACITRILIGFIIVP